MRDFVQLSLRCLGTVWFTVFRQTLCFFQGQKTIPCTPENREFIRGRVTHGALPVPPQVLLYQGVLGHPCLPARKKWKKHADCCKVAIHCTFQNHILNSLIIRQVKTKEIRTITVVWKSNFNCHRFVRFYFFVFTVVLVSIEKIYQTLERVFHCISKHPNIRQR